jgi:hypothetical protein
VVELLENGVNITDRAEITQPSQAGGAFETGRGIVSPAVSFKCELFAKDGAKFCVAVGAVAAENKQQIHDHILKGRLAAAKEKV